MLLRKAVTPVKWSRALVLAVVVAIHLLLLKIPWPALRQALSNQPSKQVAPPDRTQTIVFLLEPSQPLATKPQGEDPQPEARPTHRDRAHESAVPAPVYGNEVSNAAATASVAPTTSPPAVAVSDDAPKPMGPSLNLTLSREALKSLAPGLAARSPFQGSLLLPLTEN